MEMQIRYEPYSQRSYKLEIMAVRRINRVLYCVCSLLCECCNAINYRCISFSIFPGCFRKLKLREVKQHDQVHTACQGRD